MYQHMRTATDFQAGATAPKTANDATASATKGDFSVAKLPTVAHRWVAKRVGVSIATGTVVQPKLQINLLDSTTGAGNKLDTWQAGLGLSTALSLVNCVNIDENDLFIPGVVNQAMTLEFSGAPAASTKSSVFLQGYAEIPD